jgi:hypothetical protein
MTPELKVACETVFQEHRASIHGIDWKKDIFRGRISTGLSEKAKETLLMKNIISYPKPGKKAITILNSRVIGASTCDEAEKILLNKVVLSPVVSEPVISEPMVSKPTLNEPMVSQPVAEAPIRAIKTKRPLADNRPIPQRFVVSSAAENVAYLEKEKWYLKPVLVYFVWPVCAAITAGAFAYLIGTIYDYIFF